MSIIAAGHTVTRDQSACTPSGFLGVQPTVLCVDRPTVNVYDYACRPKRAAQCNAVQPDGSILHPGSVVIPEWIAFPHFFATQRLIVIYVGNAPSLERLLQATLRPAIPTST